MVELEPTVPVAGRSDRKGDFRVRRSGDPWTYVEVSATDRTATEREALRLLERLGEPVHSMSGFFALELFFRSQPNEDEVEALLRRVRDLDGATRLVERKSYPRGWEPWFTTPPETPPT